MASWTTIIDIVVTGVVPVLLAWVASVEIRFRKMQNIPDRKEMDQSIELHQRDVRVLQQELKDDIKRMEKKLDKMIDKLG